MRGRAERRSVVARGAALAAVAVAIAAPAAQARVECGDPGAQWERRTPKQAGFDARRLQSALDWATRHTSASIAVYRHGCLAGRAALDLAHRRTSRSTAGA